MNPKPLLPFLPPWPPQRREPSRLYKACLLLALILLILAVLLPRSLDRLSADPPDYSDCQPERSGPYPACHFTHAPQQIHWSPEARQPTSYPYRTGQVRPGNSLSTTSSTSKRTSNLPEAPGPRPPP